VQDHLRDAVRERAVAVGLQVERRVRIEPVARVRLARDDRRLTFVEEIREEDAGAVGPAVLPSEAAARRAELRRQLVAAFAQLPPALRETYTLFQIGERSVREIAAETGVGESLVKVRIFRAKEKLRAILSEMGVTF